jgi:rhodanese-related sulfurtransferase
MSKQHAAGFLALVDAAKSRITQLSMMEYPNFTKPHVLVDVREDSEWQAGHLPNAIHLGKGIIERDIEKSIPDKHSCILLYCGGGFRSALVADVLQQMGYQQVISLDGGYSAWVGAGLPVVTPG